MRKKPVPFAISRQELLELGQSLDNLEKQALFFEAYLSAARISEALALQKRDIWQEIVEGKPIMVSKLVTSKTKESMPLRNLPVALNGIEGQMGAVVWQYRESKENEEDKLFHYSRRRAGNIFASLKVDVRAINERDKTLVDLVGMNIYPHYLRHCRLTHLIVHHGYTPTQLMWYAGWINYDMVMTYVKLDWKQLLPYSQVSA